MLDGWVVGAAWVVVVMKPTGALRRQATRPCWGELPQLKAGRGHSESVKNTVVVVGVFFVGVFCGSGY